MSNKAMSDCEEQFSLKHQHLTTTPKRQIPPARLYMTDNKNSTGFLLEMDSKFSDQMDMTVQPDFCGV